MRSRRCQRLQVLALSIDNSEAKVPKYMQHHRYALNAAMMAPVWQRVLGTRRLPVSWAIGRDGKLKQVESRALLNEDSTAHPLAIIRGCTRPGWRNW